METTWEGRFGTPRYGHIFARRYDTQVDEADARCSPVVLPTLADLARFGTVKQPSRHRAVGRHEGAAIRGEFAIGDVERRDGTMKAKEIRTGGFYILNLSAVCDGRNHCLVVI